MTDTDQSSSVGRSPDAAEDGGAQARLPVAGGTRRWQQVVGVLGIGVALWVGGELYDAVTFDGFASRPVQDAPAGPQGGGGHVPGPPAGGH